MARPSKITPEEVNTILQLYKEGKSLRQIETLTKTCSFPTISRIINSHTLTPEQLESKRQKHEVTKKIKDAERRRVEQLNEVTTKAMQTIASTQAIKETEEATSSAFTEEYQKTKEQMKKLLSLANTNHKNSIEMLSEVIRNVKEQVQSHGKHMSMADNKRVVEILDLGTEVMSKVFHTLGFDIRNELIQLSMRKADEKNTPILKLCNDKGEIVDIFLRDHVTKERM